MRNAPLHISAKPRFRPTVLLIEDEATLVKNLVTFLTRAGYEVFAASSGEAGLALLNLHQPQVVLLDLDLPGISGFEVLARILPDKTDSRVVVITGTGSEDTALATIKDGVDAYLIKPLVLAGLLPIIDRLARRPVLADGVVAPVLKLVGGTDKSSNLAIPASPVNDRLEAKSEATLALEALIVRINEVDVPMSSGEPPAVLITGETGVGKEWVARALHQGGRRRAGSFVEINCGGIPASMIEAELFGHERCAFTDAREAKPGLIESAAGGTLFLDEIGGLDLPSQAKLLRVLEGRRVRRLGGLEALRRGCDARIVATTSCDLEKMVRDGLFRADLYFRLRMIHVQVPPLRERGVDVPGLAAHFMAGFTARYAKPDLRLSSEAMAALTRHSWPGNVRELKNAIERAVVLAAGSAIGASELLWVLHATGDRLAGK